MGAQMCSQGNGMDIIMDVLRSEKEGATPIDAPIASFVAERIRGGDACDLDALQVRHGLTGDSDSASSTDRRGFEPFERLQEIYEVRDPSMQDPPETLVAVHRTSGMLRRLVTVRKPCGAEQQERLKSTLRHFQALQSDGVARVCEVFENSRALSLVTEHCSGGTVYDRILQRQYFAEQETAVLIRHVLHSLAALHRRGLAHGHPTPDSFRFQSEAPHASLKLVDFGLDMKVQMWDLQAAAYEATPALLPQRDRRASTCLQFFETCRIVFCAPEVVRPLQAKGDGPSRSTPLQSSNVEADAAAGAGANVLGGFFDGDLLGEVIDAHIDKHEDLDTLALEAADAWSVGAITFLLLCGYPPFFAPCRYAILSRIDKMDYAFDPPFWSKISEEAKDFVQQCLQANPSERMTVREALRHPWISSLADSSPSGSMLSSFALNLRRFYRTSLIETFAANSLAAKLDFTGLKAFYRKCCDSDPQRSGFFTATDLRQVLIKLELSEIAEAISLCFSRTLRHPGESYIDYNALTESVRARRERLLEQELWTCFLQFAEEAQAPVTESRPPLTPVKVGQASSAEGPDAQPAITASSSSSSAAAAASPLWVAPLRAGSADDTGGVGEERPIVTLGPPVTPKKKVRPTGRVALSQLEDFLAMPQVRRALQRDGLQEPTRAMAQIGTALGTRKTPTPASLSPFRPAEQEAAGSSAAERGRKLPPQEVEFIDLAAEVIRRLPVIPGFAIQPTS
eukprot:TRINITY_DN6899_c0_g1_i1.p1 TRINITY_DN6899_c0_g1~~TRINITY_DN6899_c0_g1_i1.p1  ORF type:complete len:739 (-),score=209.25 TRINITY_DN6899_c0_g1_i1:217-2433(-)